MLEALNGLKDLLRDPEQFRATLRQIVATLTPEARERVGVAARIVLDEIAGATPGAAAAGATTKARSTTWLVGIIQGLMANAPPPRGL